MHSYRGDYARVIELATDNLAALPAAWVYDYFGMGTPPSVWDRAWRAMSLAQLGRFAEAARDEAETIRLAEPTRHASTLSLAYFAASAVHLLKGDWARARVASERWIATARSGNVALQLPWAVASAAWAEAQLDEGTPAFERIREGEELVDRVAERGIVGNRGWAYQALGRACLLRGQLDHARSLAARAIESSPHHPGFAGHALHLLGDIAAHRDRFDAESGEAHYSQALALAERHGMRPLSAHCHLGLGQLHGHAGGPQEADQHLATAATLYRAMDMGFWLEQAEAALEALGRSGKL